MNLAELIAAGGIVPDELVPETLTWNGQTVAVKVKRLGYGEVEREILARTADQTSNTAWLIAASIRLGDGTERLTYEQAYRLDAELFKAMSEAVTRVNSLGKTGPLPPTRKSGTSSSSRGSGDGQSRKPRRR